MTVTVAPGTAVDGTCVVAGGGVLVFVGFAVGDAVGEGAVVGDGVGVGVLVGGGVDVLVSVAVAVGVSCGWNNAAWVLEAARIGTTFAIRLMEEATRTQAQSVSVSVRNKNFPRSGSFPLNIDPYLSAPASVAGQRLDCATRRALGTERGWYA